MIRQSEIVGFHDGIVRHINITDAVLTPVHIRRFEIGVAGHVDIANAFVLVCAVNRSIDDKLTAGKIGSRIRMPGEIRRAVGVYRSARLIEDSAGGIVADISCAVYGQRRVLSNVNRAGTQNAKLCAGNLGFSRQRHSAAVINDCRF